MRPCCSRGYRQKSSVAKAVWLDLNYIFSVVHELHLSQEYETFRTLPCVKSWHLYLFCIRPHHEDTNTDNRRSSYYPVTRTTKLSTSSYHANDFSVTAATLYAGWCSREDEGSIVWAEYRYNRVPPSTASLISTSLISASSLRLVPHYG